MPPLQCQLTHELEDAFERLAGQVKPGISVGKVGQGRLLWACHGCGLPLLPCLHTPPAARLPLPRLPLPLLTCLPPSHLPSCPQIDGTIERGLVSRFQLQGGYHAVFHINGTETRLYCDGHACEGQRLATKQARHRGALADLRVRPPACLPASCIRGPQELLPGVRQGGSTLRCLTTAAPFPSLPLPRPLPPPPQPCS